MEPEPGKAAEPDKEKAQELPVPINGQAIYAYNLDDRQTPGGLKVRWKVRIVSGEKATRYDARQAQAIKELLQWSRHHPHDAP